MGKHTEGPSVNVCLRTLCTDTPVLYIDSALAAEEGHSLGERGRDF